MSSTDRSILKNVIKHIQEKDHDPFTPLIDEYLVKRELPKYKAKRLKKFSFDVLEKPRPLGRLSPSSICGCERQAALKFMGVEGQKRIDPDTELIFLDGHWRHHKWDYIFLDMAAMFPKRIRVIAIEQPVWFPKLRVAGSLDIHVEIKVNGHWLRYVIDFKGANNWAFQFVHREHKPKYEHVLQVLPYMRSVKCRRGGIIYDSKEKNHFYIFTFDFKKEEWKLISEWCDRVLEQIERHVLPRMHPECSKGNFWGDRCVYRGLCYGSKDEDDIEEEIFQNFTSIEDLWEEGIRIEEASFPA